MQRLLEKKSLLKADEKAFVTRSQFERIRQQYTIKPFYKVIYRPLNRIRPRPRRSPSKEDRPKPIKCFAYKGEYKWRNYPYIEENMKEI
jgi:hypothetical protein